MPFCCRKPQNDEEQTMDREILAQQRVTEQVLVATPKVAGGILKGVDKQEHGKTVVFYDVRNSDRQSIANANPNLNMKPDGEGAENVDSDPKRHGYFTYKKSHVLKWSNTVLESQVLRPATWTKVQNDTFLRGYPCLPIKDREETLPRLKIKLEKGDGNESSFGFIEGHDFSTSTAYSGDYECVDLLKAAGDRDDYQVPSAPSYVCFTTLNEAKRNAMLFRDCAGITQVGPNRFELRSEAFPRRSNCQEKSWLRPTILFYNDGFDRRFFEDKEAELCMAGAHIDLPNEHPDTHVIPPNMKLDGLPLDQKLELLPLPAALPSPPMKKDGDDADDDEDGRKDEDKDAERVVGSVVKTGKKDESGESRKTKTGKDKVSRKIKSQRSKVFDDEDDVLNDAEEKKIDKLIKKSESRKSKGLSKKKSGLDDGGASSATKSVTGKKKKKKQEDSDEESDSPKKMAKKEGRHNVANSITYTSNYHRDLEIAQTHKEFDLAHNGFQIDSYESGARRSDLSSSSIDSDYKFHGRKHPQKNLKMLEGMHLTPNNTAMVESDAIHSKLSEIWPNESKNNYFSNSSKHDGGNLGSSDDQEHDANLGSSSEGRGCQPLGISSEGKSVTFASKMHSIVDIVESHRVSLVDIIKRRDSRHPNAKKKGKKGKNSKGENPSAHGANADGSRKSHNSQGKSWKTKNENATTPKKKTFCPCIAVGGGKHGKDDGLQNNGPNGKDGHEADNPKNSGKTNDTNFGDDFADTEGTTRDSALNLRVSNSDVDVGMTVNSKPSEFSLPGTGTHGFFGCSANVKNLDNGPSGNNGDANSGSANAGSNGANGPGGGTKLSRRGSKSSRDSSESNKSADSIPDEHEITYRTVAGRSVSTTGRRQRLSGTTEILPRTIQTVKQILADGKMIHHHGKDQNPASSSGSLDGTRENNATQATSKEGAHTSPDSSPNVRKRKRKSNFRRNHWTDKRDRHSSSSSRSSGSSASNSDSSVSESRVRLRLRSEHAAKNDHASSSSSGKEDDNGPVNRRWYHSATSSSFLEGNHRDSESEEEKKKRKKKRRLKSKKTKDLGDDDEGPAKPRESEKDSPEMPEDGQLQKAREKLEEKLKLLIMNKRRSHAKLNRHKARLQKMKPDVLHVDCDLLHIAGTYKITDDEHHDQPIWKRSEDERGNDSYSIQLYNDVWQIVDQESVVIVESTATTGKGEGPLEILWKDADIRVFDKSSWGKFIDSDSKFIDSDFYPGKSSLGIFWENSLMTIGDLDKYVVWIRASELCRGQRLKVFSVVEPTDVSPNIAANIYHRWLYAAISAVAETPMWIEENIFLSPGGRDGVDNLLGNSNPNAISAMGEKLHRDGKYCVNLFDPVLKRWREINVDEFVPCNKFSRHPMFSRPSHNEIYTCLIEKAMAKLLGSYAHLGSRGNIAFGLAALTGCAECERWRITNDSGEFFRMDIEYRQDKEKGSQSRQHARVNRWVEATTSHGGDYYPVSKKLDAMWDYVIRCEANNYILLANVLPGSADSKKDSEVGMVNKNGERIDGLLEGHSYTVIGVCILHDSDGESQGEECRLLHLRNPWYHNDLLSKPAWTGAWSYGSKEWKYLDRYELLERGVRAGGVPDDGDFYIKWEDFCKLFFSMIILPMDMGCRRRNIGLMKFFGARDATFCTGDGDAAVHRGVVDQQQIEPFDANTWDKLSESSDSSVGQTMGNQIRMSLNLLKRDYM